MTICQVYYIFALKLHLDNNIYIILKTFLRKFRFENGELSQQQLADMVSVSRQTIVAIERGDYNLSVKLALLLAYKLNTKVENLFQLEEKDYV